MAEGLQQVQKPTKGEKEEKGEAGRKPSQSLRIQNDTRTKAIAIPRRKRVNNQWAWIWKERDNVKFNFPLYIFEMKI